MMQNLPVSGFEKINTRIHLAMINNIKAFLFLLLLFKNASILLNVVELLLLSVLFNTAFLR